MSRRLDFSIQTKIVIASDYDLMLMWLSTEPGQCLLKFSSESRRSCQVAGGDQNVSARGSSICVLCVSEMQTKLTGNVELDDDVAFKKSPILPSPEPLF